jgi:hypothetical protein
MLNLKFYLLDFYERGRRSYEAWSYHTKSVFQIQDGNNYISSIISESIPSAIGKIGSVELFSVRHYLKTRFKKYKNRDIAWEKHRKSLYVNAGVFPPTGAVYDRWAEIFLEEIRKMTVLGVWFNVGEANILKNFCPYAKLMPIRSLEPYYSVNPWSKYLKGKKVVVLHPFTDSIEKQYLRRTEIWLESPDILPEFELITIKVPLSNALIKSPFPDWFEALNYLKSCMENIKFDVAIIGAGAYSIPLAAHARTIGKIGIHIGGATQILFGIKGSRWDRHPVISKFYNSSWCRPNEEETPNNNREVEKGCYW